MRLGIVRLYTGESGKIGYYNIQEIGLAKQLVSNLNIEVDIFILRDKNKCKKIEILKIEEHIRLVYLPVVSIGNHGILNPNILSSFKLDIIQLNSDNQIGCYSVIKWAIKQNIPIYTYIGTIESDSSNKLKRIISKIIFRHNFKMMNKVTNVAKTPKVIEKLTELQVEKKKLIPVGLDIENLKNLKVNKEIITKYKIPQDKKIISFVGRLEKYKKPFKALELFNYILQKDRNYHFVVVGNGSLKDDFLKEAKDLKIDNNLTYIKEIENKNMKNIYLISDVFINMNDKEIYGMSILEAMYCRCPVIAKRASGPEYIICNGESGYILDDYNMSHWYEKIKEISLNREFFSKNSRRRIESYFEWKVICEKYNDLFIELSSEVKINAKDK